MREHPGHLPTFPKQVWSGFRQNSGKAVAVQIDTNIGTAESEPMHRIRDTWL